MGWGDRPWRGSRSRAAALAAPWTGLPRSDSVRRMPKRQVHRPHVRARVRRKSERDKDFWREVRELGVVAVGVVMVTGDRMWRSWDATCPSRAARGPKPVQCLTVRRWCFPTWGRNCTRGAELPHARQRERGTLLERTAAAHPTPPGSGMARAVVTRPTAHPEAEGKLVCPFLTALQILLQLQPLPQPLCRNERSRTSSSRRRSISHCPSGTSLETRRMSAPWVRGRACTCLSAGQGLGENEVRGRRLRRKEEGRTRGDGVGRGGEGCWWNLD